MDTIVEQMVMFNLSFKEHISKNNLTILSILFYSTDGISIIFYISCINLNLNMDKWMFIYFNEFDYSKIKENI